MKIFEFEIGIKLLKGFNIEEFYKDIASNVKEINLEVVKIEELPEDMFSDMRFHIEVSGESLDYRMVIGGIAALAHDKQTFEIRSIPSGTMALRKI